MGRPVKKIDVQAIASGFKPVCVIDLGIIEVKLKRGAVG
jgi:hypothetical protein